LVYASNEEESLTSNIYYMEYTTSWQSPVLLSLGEATSQADAPNVCVDTDGDIHVAWGSWDNVSAPIKHIAYRKRVGGVWGDTEYISEPSAGSGWASYCFMSLTRGGEPVVVEERRNAAGTADIYYSYKFGDDWTSVLVIGSSGVNSLQGGMFAYYPRVGNRATSSPYAELFSAAFINPSADMYYISADYMAPPTYYPTNAITRVTGIKVRYRNALINGGKTQYDMLVTEGGLAILPGIDGLTGVDETQDVEYTVVPPRPIYTEPYNGGYYAPKDPGFWKGPADGGASTDPWFWKGPPKDVPPPGGTPV